VGVLEGRFGGRQKLILQGASETLLRHTEA
jgi:hypothetical protein